MSTYMFIALQDDDKILAFTMDTDTGKLTPKAEVSVSGGPSLLAMSPDRTFLYVGHRSSSEISSFRVDQDTGGLTWRGTIQVVAAPTFLATDRKGKFMLSAYYHGGHVAVHPIEDNGVVRGSNPSLTNLYTKSRSARIPT